MYISNKYVNWGMSFSVGKSNRITTEDNDDNNYYQKINGKTNLSLAFHNNVIPSWKHKEMPVLRFKTWIINIANSDRWSINDLK